ncbi:unnamed protein product [Sphagnum balticum]
MTELISGANNSKLYLLMQNDLTIAVVTKRPSDFRRLTVSILTDRYSPYTAYYKKVSDLEFLDKYYTYTRRRPI